MSPRARRAPGRTRRRSRRPSWVCHKRQTRPEQDKGSPASLPSLSLVVWCPFRGYSRRCRVLRGREGNRQRLGWFVRSVGGWSVRFLQLPCLAVPAPAQLVSLTRSPGTSSPEPRRACSCLPAYRCSTGGANRGPPVLTADEVHGERMVLADCTQFRKPHFLPRTSNPSLLTNVPLRKGKRRFPTYPWLFSVFQGGQNP